MAKEIKLNRSGEKPLRNARQEKFALNLLKGMTQQKAAIQAGYTPKTARKTASRLMTNEDIWRRYRTLQVMAATDGVMGAEERKERLSEIARARLTDFVECGADGAWINIGLETAHSAALQELTSRTEYDENGAHPTIVTKLKLHDPVKSIAELNKMDGDYAPEKHLVAAKIIFEVVYVDKRKELTDGDGDN